tara:strand:+ start:1454 stop:3847 length:2394 start_codon:yes stop_codon:yes gene_type:complete
MKLDLKIITLIVFTFLMSCEDKPKKKSSTTIKKQEKVITGTIEKIKEIESNKPSIIYNESKDALKSYYDISHLKEFYREYTPPPTLKHPQDLSSLSYEELRLLRNEVFARNGYLFSDGYLRGYFNHYNWYKPVFDVDTFKIVFNQKERELVDACLKEELKRKERKTIEKDGLELYNSELITNSKQFTRVQEKIFKDFNKQNFSIINASRSMPFYVYDQNAYQYIPHYITTDLYLFILHKYFSRFIEKLEENHLYSELMDILYKTSSNLATLEGNNQSSIEWAQMYNAIALYAIGDTFTIVPEKYKLIFDKETKNIDMQAGAPSFIKNRFVEYKELKPRGHYTKSDTLKKYFKAFKWISLNGINLADEEELKGLVTFAYAIKSDQDLHKKYKKYISTIEKLAGQEDNISLINVIDVIDNSSLNDALSKNKISELRNSLSKLNKEKVKKVFLKPVSEAKAGRAYFLSSTYSISGEIFSKLISENRTFPNGLDIPAVFGNKTAEKILKDEFKEDENCSKYLANLKQLKEQFADFSDWNHNYGYIGVKTALSAYAEKENYPNFMKTNAYNRKELSTTLSSWTHIKHDLILYQEKPFAAEGGQGGGPEPPLHYSYVEPNIVFWESALELIDWLEKLAKNKESTFINELERIKNLGILLRDITIKELNGENITKEEHKQLHYVGATIEYILLALLETDHLPEREESMALIADVYAFNSTNLNVAVGHADDIYVIVPINGEYHIARGSVFSYHEFKGEIHNDEEWRQKVKKGNIPERPIWIKPLINNLEPLRGRMTYRYYSDDI